MIRVNQRGERKRSKKIRETERGVKTERGRRK